MTPTPSTTTTKPVTARAKARAAVAAIKAERAARDKRIEEQAVTWFVLADKITALHEQIEAARAEQVAVIGALDHDELSVAATATMLDLTDTEVRALRKQHRDTGREGEDQAEVEGENPAATQPQSSPSPAGGVDDEQAIAS